MSGARELIELLAGLERAAREGGAELAGALRGALERVRELRARGVAPEEQAGVREALRAALERLQELSEPAGVDGTSGEPLLATLRQSATRLLASLEVAERLRRLRQERGLTTGMLARLAQVDQSYVSRLEYGAHGPPSPRTVRRLALALGVGPDALAPGLVPPAGPEPPALVVLSEAGGLVEREQLLRWSSLGRRLYQAGFFVFRVAPGDREEVVQLVEELLVTLERDAPDVRRLRLQLIRGVLGLRGAERLEKTRRTLEGAFPEP